MKSESIHIGEVYAMRVAGLPRVVRVVRAHHRQGWIVRTIATGREVHARSERRFRYLVPLRVLLHMAQTAGMHPKARAYEQAALEIILLREQRGASEAEIVYDRERFLARRQAA